MTRKKKNTVATAETISRPDLDSILEGKWGIRIFFLVYLAITIFMFREFFFSGGMLFGTDTIPDGIYTRQYYKEYFTNYGGVPRWNPFILGGMPFVDAMHGDTFYPGAWLSFIMPLTRALGLKLIIHVFIAGLTMFAFLRTLRLRSEAAFLGGLMYMLAPSFVTLVYPGHDAKMYVIAFIPLAFTFLEHGMNKPRVWSFAGLGGIMGLLILTSHAQMAYYSFWALGLYFVFRMFYGLRTEKLKKITLFGMAVVLAMGLGAVQLLPAFKFTTIQSVRAGEERTAYEYATSWSLHPEEIAGMVVPSFQGYRNDSGGNYADFYWGRNPFKLNSDYHGIITLIFGFIGFLVLKDKKKWIFLGIGVLSLIYSLGANTPVYRLFYSFVPGVKNFRAPSMIIFLFLFAFVVAGAMFMDSLLEGRTIWKKGKDKRLLYAAGGIIASAVILSIAGSGLFEMWKSIFYGGMDERISQNMVQNVPYFTKDLWRTALIGSFSLTAIWLFSARKIGSFALTAFLALIILFDQAGINARFINVIDTNWLDNPENTIAVLKDKTRNELPFRTLGMFGQKNSPNYFAMYGIQMADGMHNNEPMNYENFRGGTASRNFTLHWLTDQGVDMEGFARNNFLKVAGVRYIIVPVRRGENTLLENPYAMHRTFMVPEALAVKSDDEALEILSNPQFDPAKQVIITTDKEIPLDRADEYSSFRSEVNKLVYTTDGAVIDISGTSGGYLVLAENWMPWWNVWIDGEPAEIERAYGTFMAVRVPTGKHEVVFRYISKPFQTGKRLTLASFGMVLLLIGAAPAKKLRTHKKGGA